MFCSLLHFGGHFGGNEGPEFGNSNVLISIIAPDPVLINWLKDEASSTTVHSPEKKSNKAAHIEADDRNLVCKDGWTIAETTEHPNWEDEHGNPGEDDDSDATGNSNYNKRLVKVLVNTLQDIKSNPVFVAQFVREGAISVIWCTAQGWL